MSHEVKLILRDGTELGSWDRYTIAIDMLSVGAPWTFSVWRSERVGQDSEAYSWSEVLGKVKLYDSLRVEIDGTVQLCGVIEERKPSHSRDGAVLVISGRDATALALECDADPRSVLTNSTLTDSLEALFRPIGVPVRFLSGANASSAARGQSALRSLSQTRRRHQVRHHRSRAGEKIWQAAEAIARRYGYMLWAGPSQDGFTVICDVPDYESSSVFTLKHAQQNGFTTSDSNVLSAELSEVVRGVPTEVVAFARAPRGNSSSARYAARQTNSELPRYSTVTSSLPSVLRVIQPRRAGSSTSSQQEAVREQNRAMRDWRSYTCTVAGHSQEVAGKQAIYAVNTMCDVRDDILGLDEPMLLLSATFEGTRTGGQTTKLKLGTRDSIQLTPEPEDG